MTKFLLPFLLFPTLLMAEDASDLISEKPSAETVVVGPNPMMQILMWVLIGVVFYLLLIRPQQKRVKEHQTLLSNLRRGDKVVTSGGIVGTIQRVLDNDELQIKVAEETIVTVLKQYVTTVLNKPEPVETTTKAKK